MEIWVFFPNLPFNETLSALDTETLALSTETSALAAEKSALGMAISALARSFRQYWRVVSGNISHCGVDITPQMCNRVTNHGDIGTFSKPLCSCQTISKGAGTQKQMRILKTCTFSVLLQLKLLYWYSVKINKIIWPAAPESVRITKNIILAIFRRSTLVGQLSIPVSAGGQA